ncbi:MAG: 1-(5-phosphoribosyl)-5-amino-4-imidazole-carboxylate carboxylase [Desulfuromonadales bacterium GWC2_61_20]|nr:MAG: 1-(5-phosphoribosyl)-5-amino-4-imidazole-carboxylate carboxylase [Desulfuromonadales bacterium GWC2_61_20]
MNQDALTTLLRAVRDGSLSLDEALAQLRHFPCEDVGVALIDHHRELRQGAPEVIFGEGKSREQLATIVARMVERGGNILATRLDPDKGADLVTAHPAGSYDPVARTFTLLQRPPQALAGTVLVVCAGTSDLPVAREAVVTARVLGCTVEELVDVGVAGIHRLLARSDKLREAAVIIVVAGMEGALPSVVGGLVAVPVIAVPTSVGYGAAFNGLAPLLGMLNSCAAGVTVVNIDNGFGAAAAAARILRARGTA